MLNHLIRLALDRRLATLALALAVSVYGLVAWRTLPVDVLPDLNRPTVSIMTEAAGLAPEEVEAAITAPIEQAVSGATGVERVRSVSGVGLSVVHVEFGWGTEVMANRQMVQERLNAVDWIGSARERAAAPRMAPVSSIMGEVMLIGLAAGSGGASGAEALNPMRVRSLADWTVRPALASIPGVAQVTVMGGEVREFQVRADPERLRAHGLTLRELAEAVGAANQTAGEGAGAGGGGGFVHGSGGGTELVVRVVGRVRTVEELGAALVATREEGGHTAAVRVRDVARVVEAGSINRRGDASMMGRPAVIMAIAKQPGADTIGLTRQIDQRLATLRPGLPADLVIDAGLFRQSRFIESAVRNVVHALRDGSVLVVVVLALFLLNLRVTVITLTAIPLSLLATAIVFKMLGQSINTMTLGGIAVAMGELVDDAIVGVENVHRRLRESRLAGSELPGAAGTGTRGRVLRTVFEATSEVRGPILLGTAIVLLAFLPLFFLPDLSGRLFTPLAWAYIVSIAASMLVSLTVTPVLAYYLLGRSRDRADGWGAGAERGDGLVLRACKGLALRAYAVALPRARLVIMLGVAAVVGAAGLAWRLGTEFLPPFNEGTAVVAIASAPGTSLDEANRMGTAAERLLLEIPEVRSVARRTGRAEQDEHALGVETSEIEVDFFRRGHAGPGPDGRAAPARIRDREAVFAEIRERLEQLPLLGVSIGQPISHRIEHLESGVRAQIVVKIAGPDLGVLRALADEVHEAISGVNGVVDVQTEAQVLTPQVVIRVDAGRAAMYGFTSGELSETLETALGGRRVSQVLDGVRSYDLVVMLDDAWVGGRTPGSGQGLTALGDVRIISPSGAVALVRDVAEIREQLGPNQIARENGQRRMVVSCNVKGRDLGAAVGAIEREVRRRVRAPEGYVLAVEGQFETQRRAARVMLGLGALSLVMMFLLLAGSFRSAVVAAQVMLNVPMAFIGAVLALWISGEPFSLASLIGLVSVCGIAVRNGVLMLSHYVHLAVREGMAFGPEMVIRGSQERVAPVLMTALTTALGLAPLLVLGHEPGKEILYPVAVVVMGGLVTCTLLDFLVTPTVFLRYGRGAVERLRAEGRGGA